VGDYDAGEATGQDAGFCISAVAEPTNLSHQLKRAGVMVTRIAMGIPVGRDIEYTDEITTLKAMEGRPEL
jgi:recombination protein RecR